MLPRIFEFLIINSLYYRVVVIRVPLQGLCYTVRDAVDWLCSPTARRFKAPTTVLYSIVNQLDTARRFM